MITTIGTKSMLFLCRMDVRDFEILSDVIKRQMHENPQRVSLVVRIDVSGPYLQGVTNYNPNWQECPQVLSNQWIEHLASLQAGVFGSNWSYSLAGRYELLGLVVFT